jgi:lysyl-tRNA synthetase, class II
VSATEERNYVEAARREKRAELEQLGVNAYAYRFERTHTAAAALAAYDDTMGDDGPEVVVAGRIAALRSQGKTAFAHIEDVSGRIQLYFRRDQLADRYDRLKLLDLDDHVGARGRLFRTRAGEVTVRVDDFELLSKSLRPLPRGKTQVTADAAVIWGGLSDAETRYRQRYADLAVHPEVRETFRTRAKVISWLRRFLDDRGFLEVETPILQPLYGGASARPFVTHHNALDLPLYLRIADELYLKRLLVGGFERVYEIGHDFRNEGMDRTHNPEFTMLEFYQAYADYQDLMQLTEEMLVGLARELAGGTELVYQGETIDLAPPWARLQFFEGLSRAVGRTVTPDTDAATLAAAAAAAGMAVAPGASAVDLWKEIFDTRVEATLVQPTFVTDFPIELSPLAKRKREDPRLVDRFELFIGRREIANAYSELNDPLDQRRRFEEQAAARDQGDDEAHWLDEDYLRALEYGMPPTAGEGIGIDRLTMLFTDSASIRDVILFPQLRPEPRPEVRVDPGPAPGTPEGEGP